jgi:hypothetical protein
MVSLLRAFPLLPRAVPGLLGVAIISSTPCLFRPFSSSSAVFHGVGVGCINSDFLLVL